MRVAFVAFEHLPNPKGSGTRIANVCRAIHAMGHELIVISLGPRPLGPALPDCEHLHIHVEEPNLLRRAERFQAAVYRALVRCRPDVVHCRGPFEGLAALRFKARTNARVIFEVNGLPSVEMPYHHPALRDAPGFEARMRDIELQVLRGADRLITQSNATRRFLKLRGAITTPVVIHNGADLHDLPSVPSSSRKELVYVGSFAPWQGLLHLLRALRRVRRARPALDVHLSAMGAARKSWRRAIGRAARRLKVEDHLSLLDAGDKAEVHALIARADLAVAPLTRDRRNRSQGCNPIKIYEYMAAGRCTLASDLPCTREIVDDERTGAFARASHPHRLAERITSLLDDDVRRASLGRAARDLVADRATWAHRRDDVRKFYDAL